MRKHGRRADRRRVVADAALIIGIHAAREKYRNRVFESFVAKNPKIVPLSYARISPYERMLRGMR